MKTVKVYMDTLKYDFEEIDGMVALVWSIKYKANILQDKIPGVKFFQHFHNLWNLKKTLF